LFLLHLLKVFSHIFSKNGPTYALWFCHYGAVCAVSHLQRVRGTWD
jgi:hypothetical protein